ncbi:MAG TPA: hypothetical protein PKC28_01775 [Bdellovibrionales bacterium]|nr:hypothetical protein [Bdellovibrionales bacterium]
MIKIILTIFIYILSAPALAAEIQFVFEYPIEYSEPTPQGLGPLQPAPANTPVKFDSTKVYWLQAKGKVPMLVLPQITANNLEPLKVSMPDVLNWPSLATQREIDNKLSELVDELTMFQEAIRKKNAVEAEQSLARMESISRLDYLNFLRGALKFIQGDVESAKESVRRGLQRYPANVQGTKFMRTLEGKAP